MGEFGGDGGDEVYGGDDDEECEGEGYEACGVSGDVG